MEMEQINRVVGDEETERDVGVGMKRKVRYADLFIRLMALVLSLAAAIILGLDKQTKVVPITLVSTLPPINVPVTAKYHYLSAFTSSLVLTLANKGSKYGGLAKAIIMLDLITATQDRIVGGTMEYIRKLEHNVSVLEKLKHSISFPEKMEGNSVLSNFTNGRSSVDVTVSGGVAFFGIEVDLRRSLVVDILKVFDKYGVEVLAANVTVDEHRQKLMVTVTANVGGGVERKEVIEMIRTEIFFV